VLHSQSAWYWMFSRDWKGFTMIGCTWLSSLVWIRVVDRCQRMCVLLWSWEWLSNPRGSYSSLLYSVGMVVVISPW
jgi:hypothetical protein